MYLPSPLLFSPLILLTNNSSVTHLQKALDKPNGLSYDDLIETTRILIVGGAETTATLLTGLIFYLLNPSPTSTSPSPLTKLTTLLRQTFPSPSQITSSTLHSLHPNTPSQYSSLVCFDLFLTQKHFTGITSLKQRQQRMPKIQQWIF